MKRLLALILLITLCLAVLALPATAAAEDETFLEIDRDGVYLHENTRKAEVLFVIPRTYYAKILDANYDPDYYLVEYNGVDGLVKRSEVSGKTMTDVENPYYTAITISAYADTYLYEKPAISSKTELAAYGKTLLYLGKAQGEQHNFGTSTWFAVSYADHVYYIHSAMTENLNLLEASFSPVHPNSVKSASASTASSAASSQSGKKNVSSDDSFDVVRLLLILGMIVPIVVILIMLFRPKRRRSSAPRHSSDRDRYSREEEEYDDY